MGVIARDAVARDQLVYAWPLPIGPEGCEVACADNEEVVMCPAWLVGDRLGPGRHHWRTPDPTRPVSAFFVSTVPVSAHFDMTTAFMIPNTGQPIRLRATGSLQIRCADPGLLIAQFVGLPFDAVNDGVLRSVSRSIERMLARLLTRRVIIAGTPVAVTDPSMLPNIIEELVAYNPTAGAVFGVELIAMMRMVIGADDGNGAYVMLPNDFGSQNLPDPNVWREDADHGHVHTNGNNGHGLAVPLTASGEIAMTETRAKSATLAGPHQSGEAGVTSGEINSAKTQRHASVPGFETSTDSSGSNTVAGEIVARPQPPSLPPHGSRPVEVPRSSDEVTQPGVPTPVPGSLTLRGIPTAEPAKDAPDVTPAPKVRSSTPSIPPPIPAGAVRHAPPVEPKGDAPLSGLTEPMPAVVTPVLPAVVTPVLPAVPPVLPAVPRPVLPAVPPPVAKPAAKIEPPSDEARGSIMGIGMSAIGATSAAGEIAIRVPAGSRVLVPGPNGLMQSATVRQLLQGYYELEVGSSGETIWVPINGVVPE